MVWESEQYYFEPEDGLPSCNYCGMTVLELQAAGVDLFETNTLNVFCCKSSDCLQVHAETAWSIFEQS